MNKWENQVDPKVKKEINDEGFEGNAAVLIGKKEDMPNLENKLESEGKAVDLATYIKLNKIVAVSAEEMEKEALSSDSNEEYAIYALIEKAKESVSRGDTSKARELYGQIRDAYSKLRLGKEEKKKVYYDVMALKTDIELASIG